MGHEVAAVLYLNSQLKVIRYMEMSHGTLTQASVYPREIVKTALRLDAAAIIMSHNHPSGVPEPSEADLALTRPLKHRSEESRVGKEWVSTYRSRWAPLHQTKKNN